MQVKTTIQTLTAAMLPLGLAACGGGAPAGPDEARVQAGAQAEAGRGTIAAAAFAADPIAPLLDDEGNIMASPPQAVPASTGARTRAMRYASAAQADKLEHGRQGGVLRVNVGGRGADAVETSVQTANGMQVAANLGHDALVFVDGADLRSAAAVADRLAQQGMTRVWLVTQ